MGMHMEPNHSYMGESRRDQRRPRQDADDDDGNGDNGRPLQIKSPMSQSEEELEEEEAEIDREEFVDAPDSQYNPVPADTGTQTEPKLIRRNPTPMDTPTPAPRVRSILPQSIPMPTFTSTPAPANGPQSETAADKKWRGRVEQALQKMTAEVAALREQLEARRLFSHSPHYRLFRGIWRWLWAAVKHVAVDFFILGIVLLYLRRKKDRRLEGAIRVLLGDAVAQVQRVKLPGLGGKKTGT
jgi:hypothetical protein